MVVNGAFEDRSTAEQWGNGRHVLFGLPGAYTPTCSAKHLPGFLSRAQDIFGKGIASIACLSVNDAFVMRAWAADNGTSDALVMVADGNATFAQALGLAMDASANAMGTRCRRFAMVIADGVVEQIFIEQPGDFSVSSADHVLRSL
jgi:peroxiredoxin